MNKVSGTLAAILESLRGFYDMRISRYRWLIVAVLFLLAFGLYSAISNSLHTAALEKRERDRQTEREQLQRQSDEWEGRAKAAEERAVAKEQELIALRSQQTNITGEIATIKHKRHKSEKHYEQALQEIDKITDADLLHRLNCERRAALGFPCSNE